MLKHIGVQRCIIPDHGTPFLMVHDHLKQANHAQLRAYLMEPTGQRRDLTKHQTTTSMIGNPRGLDEVMLASALFRTASTMDDAQHNPRQFRWVCQNLMRV